MEVGKKMASLFKRKLTFRDGRPTKNSEIVYIQKGTTNMDTDFVN